MIEAARAAGDAGLLALTWVHSGTGVKIPVQEIAEATKAIVVLDGLHGSAALRAAVRAARHRPVGRRGRRGRRTQRDRAPPARIHRSSLIRPTAPRRPRVIAGFGPAPVSPRCLVADDMRATLLRPHDGCDRPRRPRPSRAQDVLLRRQRRRRAQVPQLRRPEPHRLQARRGQADPSRLQGTARAATPAPAEALRVPPRPGRGRRRLQRGDHPHPEPDPELRERLRGRSAARCHGHDDRRVNAGPAGAAPSSNVLAGLPSCPGSTVVCPGVPVKTASQATCATWDPYENPDPPGCDWFTRPEEPR